MLLEGRYPRPYARQPGSLLTLVGTTTGYGIQPPGPRHDVHQPGQEIYLGQVVVSNRDVDIDVNPARRTLDQHSFSASDEALRLTPPQDMGLKNL